MYHERIILPSSRAVLLNLIINIVVIWHTRLILHIPKMRESRDAGIRQIKLTAGPL